MEGKLEAAEAMIVAIAQLKERAEAAVRLAEEANSKANSESGFAFNAKQNAEEHAKTISQIRGTVEADLTWLTTTKKNIEDLQQAIITAKATTDADTRAATEARLAIEKDAATIRSASERVNAVLPVVEKTQADVAAALKVVTKESAEVTAAKATAEASATVVQTLQTQVNEAASKVNVDASVVAKAEAQSKSHLASINEVVATSNVTHERVVNYQEELKALTESFNELNNKIEGLLPNATSAGLASAFRNQKGRFKKPQIYWLSTFVVTILVLLLTGFIGLPGISPGSNSVTQESWDAILRHLTSRLPIVAPLVWLAIYAGRHYTLALRVEEEYAFKEAMSTSFEGYKREMASISDLTNSEHPPINILCENVLRSIARRPGGIYEGSHDDITPLSPVKGMIEKVVDTAAGMVRK